MYVKPPSESVASAFIAAPLSAATISALSLTFLQSMWFSLNL